MRFQYLCLLLVVSLGLPPALAQEEDSSVSLVVLIALDQARADYLEDFSPLFTGGLKRLLEDGLVFENAHHAHAITTTGPGYASIATGRFPSGSGIIDNYWYDRDQKQRVYCVEDPTVGLVKSGGGADPASPSGRSPRQLRVPSLGDWIKEADPKARVYSISQKDRAAVLMGGKKADAAFWYEPDSGTFASSTYYLQQLPPWLEEFHAESFPDSFFGTAWEPLPLAVDQADSREAQRNRVEALAARFSHAMGGPSPVPSADFYSAFGQTPFMDEYLGRLAERLITAAKLGQRQSVDYLGIGFSALDLVGHRFGPDSREVMDALLRLDETLERFFDFLDQAVGLSRTLIVVTSDHGVMQLPESPGSPPEARRLGDQEVLCLQRQGEELGRRLGLGASLFLRDFYLNYEALSEFDLRRSEVEQMGARLFSRCDFVRKVWTHSELSQESAAEDEAEDEDEDSPFFDLYSRSFDPSRSANLILQFQPYFLPRLGFGTTHGSPYPYDTAVPLIFFVPETSSRRYSHRVATVDIVPTIASLLGLKISDELDGRKLF